VFLIGYHSEENLNLNIEISEYNFDSIIRLLQAMCYDPVINNKTVKMLKMDSYRRRLVLNNWLEELRRNDAPYTFMQSLAFLFDDSIADKVLTFMNNHPVRNIEND
jgi:hypothetical protein